METVSSRLPAESPVNRYLPASSVVVVATCAPAAASVTVAPGTAPVESRTVPESVSCCAALSDAHRNRAANSGSTSLARTSAFIPRTSIKNSIRGHLRFNDQILIGGIDTGPHQRRDFPREYPPGQD